jgi:hypothetical protein
MVGHDPLDGSCPVDRKAGPCDYRNMDLEAARKTLSKRNKFSAKRIAFFVVAAVGLVGGLLLRSGQYFAQPEMQQNAPVAVAPSAPSVAAPPAAPPEAQQTVPAPMTQSPSPAVATPAGGATESPSPSPSPAENAVAEPSPQNEPAGEAVNAPADAADAQADQPQLPEGGIILVAKRPVDVRASPSASAPSLYGLPAGRPFRVVGREGGFAHIEDLKSNAGGWIDETALALPPQQRAPRASTSAPPSTSARPANPAQPSTVARPVTPAQPKAVSASGKPASPSAGQKPATTPKDGAAGGTATTDSDAATQPEGGRPGLFGRGGLFGGIFNNNNN